VNLGVGATKCGCVTKTKSLFGSRGFLNTTVPIIFVNIVGCSKKCFEKNKRSKRMIDQNTAWMLLAYVVGTGFGMWVARPGIKVVEATIDNLIAKGYLRHRIDEKGEVEILKYNEE
jgi:hypothetical protein